MAVSQTSVPGKVTELIILSAITHHVQDNWVIRPLRKYGFRKGRFCVTNLISFHDKMTCQVDKGKAVDVVYLDLSTAFDTISHSVLLEKLAAHGPGGCTVPWAKSWLAGRARRVVLSGVTSRWRPVTGGVPRAPCWGQPCFMPLSMTWARAPSAPSASLQVTPSWGQC